VLLWLSVPLTLMAVVFLGVASTLVAYYVRHTRKHSYEATKANDRYSRTVLERLGLFRLTKLTATSEREALRTRMASQEVRDKFYWLSKVVAGVDLIMEPMVLLCGGAILFLAISTIGLSLSEVGIFLLILLRLLPLAKEVMRSRQSLNACVGSFSAVISSYAYASAMLEPKRGGKPFSGLRQSIRFENVTFSYPDALAPTLSNVSLDIRAGRVTALVGSSGAGKTTLADIIPRLRVHQKGRVLYDGVDGEDFDLNSLRRGIAFVSQDTSILDGTVAENLRFVRPEANETELWGALAIAQAAEFVRSLPEGIESPLGERGIRLSGGQKQRLSLARGLLQKTSILILDEPTSALDYETEQGIRNALEELRTKGDVTVIIIAHRLSTIRNADQIVVMKGGCVIEQGTHEQLMVSEDWYSRVVGMQAGED
jgi:ABC-type multidrug transport system fused ATPase/permease subunit